MHKLPLIIHKLFNKIDTKQQKSVFCISETRTDCVYRYFNGKNRFG